MIVSGSILSSKISPKEAIKIFDKTSIDYIHIDIMDGKFVENKSFTVSDVEKFSLLTRKPLDIHLMVKNPESYIDKLSMLNVINITFHYEAIKTHMNIINHIRRNGIKVGIAIKPETSVKDIFPLLPNIDLVLIMTVNPGASGQKFMDSMLYKIEVLKHEITEKQYKCSLSVDGGVAAENIDILKEKGVDIIVSSSYLLEGNTEEKIRIIKC